MDRIRTTENSTSTDQPFIPCHQWIDSQDVIYQISSLLFAVAFLIPDDFRCHVTLMRASLCLGCACAIAWGASVLCHIDVIAWYSVFLSINVFHLTYAVCVAWPTPVRPELRDLHARLFRPLKITHRQFRELAGCGQIMDIPRGTEYAIEGSTGAGERLSILLTGRLKTTAADIFLHSITSNQFIDSPEYEASIRRVPGAAHFQVTISSVESSRILTWYIQDLQTHLNTRPDVQEVFRGLLARDVITKMNQIQQMFLQHPQHWRVLSGQTEQELRQEAYASAERKIERPRTVESWTNMDRQVSEMHAADGEYGLMWAARHKRETFDDRGLDQRARRDIELQNIIARSSSAAYISPLYMSNLSFTTPRCSSSSHTNDTAACSTCTPAATASSSSATAAARPRNIFFRANRAGSLESTTSSRCVTPTHHLGTTPVGPYSPSQVSFETFV